METRNLSSLTGQAPVRQEMISRKWTWICYTLRRPNYYSARQALHWNPKESITEREIEFVLTVRMFGCNFQFISSTLCR